MVGSAQGWREAPYVDTPAAVDALVGGLVRVATARGTGLYIVPGVIARGELPNVMRGEETQIVGALAGDPEFGANGAATLVGLPGTHAKWVDVQGGRIVAFHTFMTGELFAALCNHTILGRTMAKPAQPDTEAFLRGVIVAKNNNHTGLLGTIFSTRTLGLTAQLHAEQQSDYLSGLLIGHELSGVQALLAVRGSTLASQMPRLIGEAALCERYRLALAEFGCLNAKIVETAAERGLWRLAAQAGLVAGPRA
jgi:2-dehydro-3-deoxygalactonokinase